MTDSGPEAQDAESMARLAAGHGAALNDLMERHAARLFQYLVRLLQNEDDASDAAQDTFIRVYRHCQRFNPNQRFSTWLYSIATNLARDQFRHRSRHPHVSLDARNKATDKDFKQSLPENSPSPSESAQNAERAALVRDAVAALPEELRLPLVLAEYEEKSHLEIGSILGCSAKAVEMRLYRARRDLRSRLGKLLKS